jgi:uncharacterized membrane protein
MTENRRGAALVTVAFVGSGVLHLIRPEIFEPLVPRILPARRTLIYASGFAELACARGLATRKPWAPLASTALLLAVWPGNWQMALTAQRSHRAHPALKAALWARVPLQLVMIRAVWTSPTDSPTP